MPSTTVSTATSTPRSSPRGRSVRRTTPSAMLRSWAVSRTIADLDGSPNIEIGHLSEAINFRNLDRDNWGRR
ncbi:MAG: hypothetical protein IKO81_08455 [Bacteroidales bacterium]|nr:hypothetical protein [Bacteroidales bacterium]